MIKFAVDNLTDMHAALQNFASRLRVLGLNEDDVFFSRLVGCELLTNVIRHCGTLASFTGEIEGDMIVISVSSEESHSLPPCPELPDVLSESGRVLYIVNAVCSGNVTYKGNTVIAKIAIKTPAE